MAHSVALAPSARRDLRHIVRYISLDNRERAEAFGRMLIDRTKRLPSFPEIGREVPELNDPTFREIIVRSYRIVYRMREAQRLVEIVRFWHAARGTPQIDAS
ncbi:MAG: type II toxin-antitoxin system RelE/ParE family toxin [Chthoniobacterales bacterium]|nr:type II toxin-antitoxin system RelE/ParE family toxin [Chthoniobacterales bacterium]